MEAGAEAAAVTVPAPSPTAKPRSRFFIVLGLVLFALGAFLFWSYASDPTGTLPGFPQVWKGWPLILCSTFLLIIGVLSLVLRRFSLGGLILSAAAAGLFTATVQTYVYSFREYDTHEENMIILEDKLLGEILARNTRNLTSDRVLAFVADAYSAGRCDTPPNFDEAAVNLVPDHSAYLNPFAPGTQYYKLEVRYRFSTFVHAEAPRTRGLATSYVRSLLKWNMACAYGAHDAKEAIDPTWINWSRGRSRCPQLPYELNILVEEVQLEKDYVCNTNTPRDAVGAVRWLAEREPDGEFKKYLSDLTVELENHRPRSKGAKP